MNYIDPEATFIQYTDILLEKSLKGKYSFYTNERKKLKEQYKDDEKKYNLELGKMINEIKIDIEISENKPEKKKDKKTDKNVHHPAHYNTGKYEVIEVINDWKLNFELGNVIKYIARAEHKKNRKEDLNKALFYLEYEIAKYRKKK